MTAILDLAILARDAMPGGGRIVLKSRIAASATENAKTSALHQVVVSVSAISDTDGSRIFHDLGMARDFAAQADGHIRVRREPDGGTSVEIHLPGVVNAARSAA